LQLVENGLVRAIHQCHRVHHHSGHRRRLVKLSVFCFFVCFSSPFDRFYSHFQAETSKTINGEDILFAMSTLGFDNYVEPLKLYLQKYRESMKGEKQPGEGFEEIDDVISASALQNISATDGSGNQVLLTYSGSQNNMQSFQIG